MWGWVLVRVVAFLAAEVVLSPVVSGCLPSCGMGMGWCGHVGWGLVGAVAFLGFQVGCNSRSDENFISKKKNLKNLPFKKRDAFFKLAVVTIVFR